MKTSIVPERCAVREREGGVPELFLRVIAVLLVAVLCLPAFAPGRAEAADGAPNVTYHTQQEIVDFVRSSGMDVASAASYAQEPVLTAPYSPGRLSDETLEAALGSLNAIRYIAGLDANVTLDDGYTQQAQAATLVNAVNGVLSHFPSQPAGMSDELYDLGLSGTSSSNLSMGYPSPASSVAFAYMGDSDSSNISTLGHRRWMLDPDMGKVGFGQVGGYSATRVFDSSNAQAWQSNVVWPAQNMPVEYFSRFDAWSVSVGKPVDASSVSVVLTRLSDRKVWRFSSNASDGYFNVNNSGYGLVGCIIFRPDPDGFSLAAGDSFRVQVSGSTMNGSVIDLDYQVNFFNMTPVVTFDARGGSAVSEQEVWLGGTASTPAEPTRGGYSFEGWYTDVACTNAYSFSTPVTADITLYAKWEAVPVTSFTDTPGSEWYMTEGWIGYATSHGLMSGYTNGDGSPQYLFGPNDDMTRGQAVTVLYRIANPGSTATSDPNDYAATSGFTDGNYPYYCNAAIRWAADHGIVTGYDDGHFGPDNPITRAELATMVYRFAKWYGVDVSNPNASAFNQAVDRNDMYSFAVEPMKWTAAVGILTGNKHGDGTLTLEANRYATRAQAAKIFSVLQRDVLTGNVSAASYVLVDDETAVGGTPVGESPVDSEMADGVAEEPAGDGFGLPGGGDGGQGGTDGGVAGDPLPEVPDGTDEPAAPDVPVEGSEAPGEPTEPVEPGTSDPSAPDAPADGVDPADPDAPATGVPDGSSGVPDAPAEGDGSPAADVFAEQPVVTDEAVSGVAAETEGAV